MTLKDRCVGFTRDCGIVVTMKLTGRRSPPWDPDAADCDVWRVILHKLDRRNVKAEYYQPRKELPSHTEIVLGIAVDLAAPDDFTDFCVSKGFIGKESEALWKHTMEVKRRFEEFFTKEEIAQLLEIHELSKKEGA